MGEKVRWSEAMLRGRGVWVVRMELWSGRKNGSLGAQRVLAFAFACCFPTLFLREGESYIEYGMLGLW